MGKAIFLSAIRDSIRNYRKAKARRRQWLPGVDAFHQLLTCSAIDPQSPKAQKYEVVNALLRRLGRDHPEAYRKQERDPPEVVPEVFQEWQDDLVLRKVDLHGIIDGIAKRQE